METSWNEAEENLIAKTMSDLTYSRAAAIQRLRRVWEIGETPPPQWRPGRPMPEANPRFGTVPDRDPEGLNPQENGAAVNGEASTAILTGSETIPALERRQKASLRQARWRAKKAGQPFLPNYPTTDVGLVA